MADTKTTDLTAVSTPADTDIFMVVQGGTNKKLTAAQLRTLLSEWDVDLVKSADEGVTNSATMQNDDELSFAVTSSELWRFELEILYTTDATGDIKFDLANSGGNAQWKARFLGESTANAIVNNAVLTATAANFTAQAFGGGSLGVIRGCLIEGFVRPDSSGTINFRFAQNTQTSGQTATVKAGSTLRAKKLTP